MAYQAFKQFAAALAITCAASTASATLYDLGTLNSTLGQSNIQISGAFDDSFTLKAGALPGALGSIVGLDVYGDLLAHYRFGVGDAASITWESWSTTNPVSVPSDIDFGDFAFSKTLSGLSTDSRYWLQLAGTATQAAYSVTVTPVPEPETFILMLTGLALVGATARRRKSSMPSCESQK